MSTDWRERYLKATAQFERETAARESAERELTRLLTRVCAACIGLDPALDRPLGDLRQVARKGDVQRLLDQSEAFADAVMRAEGERARPGVLQRLLERPGVPERAGRELMALWAKVSANPGSASDAQLDRLAALLQQVGGVAEQPAAVAQEAPRAGRSLLGRLIGRAPAVEPNRQLLELLDSIEWPGELAVQVPAFREKLAADKDADAWIGVVRDISQLARQALNQAQASARSTEQFLSQLNEQLAELDEHMLAEGQRREDSRQSRQDLGQQMTSEVGSLADSVRSIDNLSDLQARVASSLERMRMHVTRHLDEENARREKAEAEAEQLRKQLTRLEQDSFDLRDQVAQTYRQAMRDPLTGLPNRRAYDEKVAHEFARWKRFGGPLALLILDVDDFKQVNDRFGHASGDKALVMIAKVLGDRPRETDFIGRYGGEEFVVLFTGAERDDALQVADAMRLGVANSGLHANGEPVPVTVSGGLAMFRDGDDPEKVFERADAALYRAKHAGKNRVEMADPA